MRLEKRLLMLVVTAALGLSACGGSPPARPNDPESPGSGMPDGADRHPASMDEDAPPADPQDEDAPQTR